MENSKWVNREEQPEQLNKLDQILSTVMDALEHGRDSIFEIAEDCNHINSSLQLQLEEVDKQVRQVIVDVDYLEKLERHARLRLMDVSRDFRSYSQEHIKEAYDKAREMQVRLMELRQQEVYLRRRRDELSNQIKKFKEIGQKADDFMQITGMAIKVLRGNVERINDTIEESFRQQQMVAWIIESQESERRKIAREIHDGPAQSIASMLIRLDLMKRVSSQGIESLNAEIDSVRNMGSESLADLRRIMFDLKPSLLHENSFCATLRDFFNDYEMKYDFNIDFKTMGKEKQYDLSLEIALFRLVQEAITNIRKHAGVKDALVKFEDNGSMLTLVIKDRGNGFDPDKIYKESYGILGMKERVSLFGGELDIITKAGVGTQVVIQVPMEGESKSG